MKYFCNLWILSNSWVHGLIHLVRSHHVKGVTNNFTVLQAAPPWCVLVLRKKKLFLGLIYFLGLTGSHRAQRYALFFNSNSLSFSFCLFFFKCLLLNQLLGCHSAHLLHTFRFCSCFVSQSLYLCRAGGKSSNGALPSLCLKTESYKSSQQTMFIPPPSTSTYWKYEKSTDMCKAMVLYVLLMSQ